MLLFTHASKYFISSSIVSIKVELVLLDNGERQLDDVETILGSLSRLDESEYNLPIEGICAFGTNRLDLKYDDGNCRGRSFCKTTKYQSYNIHSKQ